MRFCFNQRFPKECVPFAFSRNTAARTSANPPHPASPLKGLAAVVENQAFLFNRNAAARASVHPLTPASPAVPNSNNCVAVRHKRTEGLRLAVPTRPARLTPHGRRSSAKQAATFHGAVKPRGACRSLTSRQSPVASPRCNEATMLFSTRLSTCVDVMPFSSIATLQREPRPIH